MQSRSGELAMRPLPAVLLDLNEDLATGKLQLRRGRVAKPVEGVALRMLDVVFGGLRETAVEDITRLGRLDGMSFELTERGKRLRAELRKLMGERPFAALSAGAPISEIERAHGERVQARTM